ncbi:hypothetical protein RJ640_015394 [Escallonia rubra]|uniref:Nudix hydrolase domain-containing protein n=1 Tax=Escallonia rubra TaxID=112253 RepID=A0AA88QQI1_9ASTE|nr:hypothetical protein RJ640_015394 [Escallonia rubra]
MEKAEEIDDRDLPPFKLLLACPSGLSPSQVSVHFDESYDRIPHPDIDLENSISEIWDQRVQLSTSLFNGKKFRSLESFHMSGVTGVGKTLKMKDDDAEGYGRGLLPLCSASCPIFGLQYGGHVFHGVVDPNQGSHVCLHLGLTDYRSKMYTAIDVDSPFYVLHGGNFSLSFLLLRTFVGTNLSPLWDKFLAQSQDDCQQCQHTSSPLGNAAVVETSDKRILVLQRSNMVGEFPDHFVFPGGHPEPEEVGTLSHQYDKDLTNSQLINRKVSQEMFDSIVREVVEEIGVPASSLCNPVFIGISRRMLNVRPAAFFFIKCSLPSKEIQQLYSSAQDGYESTQLYTVPVVSLCTLSSMRCYCIVHVVLFWDKGDKDEALFEFLDSLAEYIAFSLLVFLFNEVESMASKMPGCHQGGFALYKLMVEAAKDT